MIRVGLVVGGPVVSFIVHHGLYVRAVETSRVLGCVMWLAAVVGEKSRISVVLVLVLAATRT